MDARFLAYYNRELQHLREMGGEFARANEKIAGRLGLSNLECRDPYVERLLEGFAFLTARVQLKLDSEFPRFTQALLQTVYPAYLAPTPSMAIAQFQPRLNDAALAAGKKVPRETALRSRDDKAACDYRTCSEIQLLPLSLQHADYVLRDLPTLQLGSAAAGCRAAILLRLACSLKEVPFARLPLDNLPLYIQAGTERFSLRLLEALLAHGRRVLIRPVAAPPAAWTPLPEACVRRYGYEDAHAVLPVSPRGFSGYRLLHEYFAMPQRFCFAELAGLARGVQSLARGSAAEIAILLDKEDVELESQITHENIQLHCTPVVNLFPRRADRILLTDRFAEHHIVIDKTRPLDYEVYQVSDVIGLGTRSGDEFRFAPFYAAGDERAEAESGRYFAINRIPRVISEAEIRRGRRSPRYTGSEVFLSLVDQQRPPYNEDIKQLAITALCTNRDLPLHMPLGLPGGDFTTDTTLPLQQIRCLRGPTPPRPAPPEGEFAWRLVHHLSLNYLSLIDSDARDGAAALREILHLYRYGGDSSDAAQADALHHAAVEPVVARVGHGSPISFARGLRVTLRFAEDALPGQNCFLLGSVLDHFLARHVSINSFTQTRITSQRGEIVQWPPRTGRQTIL